LASVSIESEEEMQKLFTILPDFLRNPDDFFRSIQREENIREKAVLLSISSLLYLLAYGFVTGLQHSFLQALSSAIKMPLLFLATMLFCLPALYFFSLALLGTPLKMIQVFTVVLTGISVTSFLLFGLAPIIFFFVLTSGNYPFFQLLTVAFVGLSSWIGVYFLWRGMSLVETARVDGLQSLGKRILMFWIVLYAFIGTQMAWRLSPFIADPKQPFILIQPSHDNFYIDVFNALGHALNIPTSDVSWMGPLGIAMFCMGTFIVMIFAGGLFFASGRSRRVEKAAEPG
jgi:hypothetical protein